MKGLCGRPSWSGSPLSFASYSSPLGELFVLGSGDGLLATGLGSGEVLFTEKARAEYGCEVERREDGFGELFSLFDKYFSGNSVDFVLKCKLAGSRFEQSVWNALRTIPYGESRSYAWVAGVVAEADGFSSRAYRAVGRACGANRLPLIVPCHRVISASGKIGGFAEGAGGVSMKRRLLEIEGLIIPRKRPCPKTAPATTVIEIARSARA